MLTKAQSGSNAAAAVILRQCENYLQTGEAAPLLTEELTGAMAESQLRPDLTRSQLFPLMVDRRGHGPVPGTRWCRAARARPRPARHLPGLHRAPAGCRGDGLRCDLSDPDSPIGHTNRKGRTNAVTAANGDPGSPYASVRPKAATMRASRIGHAGGFSPFCGGLQAGRDGSRARLRGAVLTRSSLAQAASAMVQAPA